MPYVGDDVQQARKRRWEDDNSEVLRFYAAATTATPEKQPSAAAAAAFFLFNQAAAVATTSGAAQDSASSSMQARKILSLSKRPRTTFEDDVHFHDGSGNDQPPLAHRRRTSQSRLGAQDQISTTTTTTNNNHNNGKRTGIASLTPCHICHRKPTKKSHLDSFAECQGCGKQTCFVCIRQCQGWSNTPAADEIATSVLSEQEVLSRSFHMHDAYDNENCASAHLQGTNSNHNDTDTTYELKSPTSKTGKGWAAGGHCSMVCSRCCIEKGAEGEVVCLGCLSGMEAA